MAIAVSAATSSPLRSCRWAPATPSASPHPDKTSAVRINGDGLCEIRASSPMSDWFLPSTTATGLQ